MDAAWCHTYKIWTTWMLGDVTQRRSTWLFLDVTHRDALSEYWAMWHIYRDAQHECSVTSHIESHCLAIARCDVHRYVQHEWSVTLHVGTHCLDVAHDVTHTQRHYTWTFRGVMHCDALSECCVTSHILRRTTHIRVDVAPRTQQLLLDMFIINAPTVNGRNCCDGWFVWLLDVELVDADCLLLRGCWLYWSAAQPPPIACSQITLISLPSLTKSYSPSGISDVVLLADFLYR